MLFTLVSCIGLVMLGYAALPALSIPFRKFDASELGIELAQRRPRFAIPGLALMLLAEIANGGPAIFILAFAVLLAVNVFFYVLDRKMLADLEEDDATF